MSWLVNCLFVAITASALLQDNAAQIHVTKHPSVAEPVYFPAPFTDGVPKNRGFAFRVSGAPQSSVAKGVTLYRVTGLQDAKTVDGWLVAAPGNGSIRKEPFGFVTVEDPDASRIEVHAETKDRRRLLVERFGDGWRIMATGPVWCDIDIYQSFEIEGRPPFEFLARRSTLQFTIEGAPDEPDVPDPITPDEPDDPPSPFSADGLQVLIVYDSDDVLSTSQAEVLYGASMLDWLDENCTKIDGYPAYRVLDKDTTGRGDSEFLKALELPRESLPWLIVGNGKKGFQGPLPASVDATIELLEDFTK